MKLLYAYIGAAAVVGILIGFVTLSIIWLTGKVSEDIRGKTVELISAYDVLFAKRSRELAALEERISELSEQERMMQQILTVEEPAKQADASEASYLSIAERFSTAAYREPIIGQTYRKIKDSFAQEPKTVLEALSKEMKTYEEGPATKLLKELTFDTVYQLSTLSPEQQKEVLESTLTGEAKELLNAYENTHKQFGAIEFYDYIQATAQLEPKKPRLWVSPIDKGPFPNGVEVIVDPDICEGFQIEMNNTIYDYCIKGRELS